MAPNVATLTRLIDNEVIRAMGLMLAHLAWQP